MTICVAPIRPFLLGPGRPELLGFSQVVGFRQVFDHQRIPIVPVALLSCPPNDRRYPNSWDCQTENSGERNDARRPVMKVVLGTHLPDSSQHDADSQGSETSCNACLLRFGPADWKSTVSQIANGISRQELDPTFGGQFLLNTDGTLAAPVNIQQDRLGARFRSLLATSLQQVQQSQEPRVFPLYSKVHTEQTSVAITSFVAATVTDVRQPHSDAIEFVLRPTRMSTATAVTGSELGRSDARPNRYIGKLRLVQ